MIKKLFLFLCLFLYVFYLSPDATDDKKNMPSIEKYKEMLTYGIEEEVIKVLNYLGRNPGKEFYTILTERYKDSVLSSTKIALINYFSMCDNLPPEITSLLFEDAKKYPENLKLHTTLLGFLGKKGGKDEGFILIERLDSYDELVQNAAADALAEMNNQDVAAYILKRLDESDTDSEKYLSDNIKGKLILGLGKMKSKEAVGYLRKIIRDTSNDKFLIMYGMVSLAEMQDIESIKTIIENLDSEEVRIQEYAAYALSIFKSKEMTPVLNKMLKHNNEKIRIFACQGIVLNNNFESVNILYYKFKNDPSMKVQNEALKSLTYLGNNGINIIKNYIKDNKFNDVQLYVISDAISSKPDDLNVNFLISIYDPLTDKKKEIIAKNVVKATSNKIDPMLIKLLKSNDQFVKVSAIRTVFNLKDSTLWNTVKELSENDPSELVKKTAKFYLDLKK